MDNNQTRFRRSLTLALGAATLTMLSLPSAARAQSMPTQPQTQSMPQDRPTQAQTMPDQSRPAAPDDDITRRDLARFDQFLDTHRGVADQLRRTPSLIDDPQFLQNHPELNAYLQDHPSVKQEISERPDTFMRLEDLYARDSNLRDRDAGGPDRDGFRPAGDRDASRPDGDRDVNRADGDQNANRPDGDRDALRADAASYDRFLDQHREIGEQVRKDPSLVDNRDFVRNHPALQSYLQDNPGVRDQLRRDPDIFMRADFSDANLRDRVGGGPDRDPIRADAVNFNRFLDGHREIAEQVRKDPTLCDNRDFVRTHPALQAYLQDNPGVRDHLRQDPNGFMQQDRFMQDRNSNPGDRDRMADFGGFLSSHPDIQKDLSRNPASVNDHDYVQNHAELDAYLNAHPDVRDQLMANPRGFVQGAQQYNNGSATGTGAAGMSGRGTATTSGASTGASTSTSTATSTNPATPHNNPKPNQ